jgi:molybdopterin biosynthesis enzyme
MTTETTIERDYVRVAELLTIREALALVLERVSALPAEPVPVEAAAGRVLAAPALAGVVGAGRRSVGG